MDGRSCERPTLLGSRHHSNRIPDVNTVLAFRHLLEKHILGERIFETVKAHLMEWGMAMKQGTIIDVTLINAQLHQEQEG